MNEKELIYYLNNIDFENSNIVYNEIEKLIKENQELKERLEIINNYLDKHYSMENQYWFDHIRDIVEDR